MLCLYGFCVLLLVCHTQLDAMQCVAKSSQNRSVSEFEKVRKVEIVTLT